MKIFSECISHVYFITYQWKKFHRQNRLFWRIFSAKVIILLVPVSLTQLLCMNSLQYLILYFLGSLSIGKLG